MWVPAGGLEGWCNPICSSGDVIYIYIYIYLLGYVKSRARNAFLRQRPGKGWEPKLTVAVPEGGSLAGGFEVMVTVPLDERVIYDPNRQLRNVRDFPIDHTPYGKMSSFGFNVHKGGCCVVYTTC